MKLFKVTNTETATTDLSTEIDTVRRVMERSGGPRIPVFSAPTHCPDCGEWGMVDHSDATAFANHCYLCSAQWVITRRALHAVADAPRLLHPTPRRGALYDDSRPNPPSNAPQSPQPTW